MRDLPAGCSRPVSLGERRDPEFRVAANPPLVALGSLLQQLVLFPRRGGRDPSLGVPSARSVLRRRRPYQGLVGSPGSEVGASTDRESRRLPLLRYGASGIPIVWWSLPTKP